MGNLSPNFSRWEFECPCNHNCGRDAADIELITVLENLRAYFFNYSVRITSGSRCIQYNKKVGGANRSYHMRAKAADIIVENISPKRVAGYLNRTYPNKYGIGNYSTFTHIDVRSRKTRWKE